MTEDKKPRNTGGRPVNPDYLNAKQEVAVEAFFATWNKTKAAEIAGYSHPHQAQSRIFGDERVKKIIKKRLDSMVMDSNEIIAKMNQIADLNISDFYTYDDKGFTNLNWDEFRKRGYLIKRLYFDRHGIPTLEFHDKMRALILLGREKGVLNDNGGGASSSVGAGVRIPTIPAELIAPDFLDVYRDICAGKHSEYCFRGGRGSTKSSFDSLMFIKTLVNNPEIHGLALRQVANTLRDSVYAQLVWAVNELDSFYPGLKDDFNCTTSPMEITYTPTGQKVYFRGADDPGKIKSIKPQFGHIGLLWFEELDQFRGEEAVRKIEQSVMRGGDYFLEFKSWNPPRTANNWVEKYCQVPKANRYIHTSNYLSVPTEWLGKPFFDEADHLKEVNPAAYEHEYLGISNGTGGLVFENVELRPITDEEIAQFDQVGQGMDFGWYPDPLAWGRSHFDAARRILYIFDEYKANKKSNRAVYDDLVKLKGYLPGELVVGDSASPKDIADFASYGMTIRGAEKGPDSVDYSIKWLQSLTKIVIDPTRCPEHSNEFINYELEQDKDGNFISAYPDKNNHFIDETRYAHNTRWRRRGQ